MRTGTLRWLERAVAPAEHLEQRFARKAGADGMTGSFLLVLPEAEDERPQEEILQSIGAECRRLSKGSLITIPGIADGSQRLRALLSELQAMHELAASPELEGDETARHEVSSRILRLETLLSEALSAAFSSALWLVDGRPRRAGSQGALNALASEVADLAFAATPVIRNELINRDHLSGNLVSARRALMTAMFQKESEERLGFEGFPPACALYLSLLKPLHVKGADGGLRFQTPEDDPFWQSTARWLASQGIVTAQALYDYWSRPPFGLKQGPMPILALAFYLANRSRIALYENGAFTPEFSDEILDEWLASPERIGLRMIEASGRNQELVAALSGKLARFRGEQPEATPLGVARAIVQIIFKSPKWSQRSASFTPATQRFKQAALKASDPLDFVFGELPAIFNEMDPARLARAVEAALEEYLSAMPGVIERMRRLILASIKAEDEDLAEVNRRAAAVRGLSGKLILEAFTSRLEKFTGSRADIEGFIGLGCAKPQFQWSDADLQAAESKLAALGFEFRQLEATASLRGRPAARRVFQVVAGGAGADLSETVELSDDEEKSAAELAQSIYALIARHGRAVALAALAEAGASLAHSKKGAS